jgi:hypothetical protein
VLASITKKGEIEREIGSNQYKVKRKGSKQRSKENRRLPWSGAPDCSVCHRTVSGAPGWIHSNCSASGFWKWLSAIIHRTVRCSTGLSDVPSGVTATAPTVDCKRWTVSYSARTARAEVRAAPEGAPDSEQWLSGAPSDCPVAPHVRAPTVEP